MSFLSRVKQVLNYLTDFIFPKPRKVLVLEAMAAGELLRTLPCATGPEEKDILALFDYAHPLVKEIIWEVKYAGNRRLSKTLGEILYDTIVSELNENGILPKEQSILLIPMPISGKRRFERGWNQAELLAKAIKDCDLGHIFRYMPGQLIKTVHTESQTKTASKNERRENLLNTMQVVNPPSVAGRLVILIDDVVTTGYTFREARRALKSADVKKILCVAVAH